MMNWTPDDPIDEDRESTVAVAPEDEKREILRDEPSAAQAVKNAAEDKFRHAAATAER